jgi:hypothetical protein
VHDPDDPDSPVRMSERIVDAWRGANLVTTRGLGLDFIEPPKKTDEADVTTAVTTPSTSPVPPASAPASHSSTGYVGEHPSTVFSE